MIFHSEILSSRDNRIVKWAASLKEKKGREAAASFIAEGEKLTFEALSADLPVTHIFINEDKKDRILQKLKDSSLSCRYAECEIYILKSFVFEKISTEIAPQGVISVIKHLDFFRQMDIIYKEEFSKNTSERAVILCSVRDPGNLGSVIRSSVAFGVSHIILSSDCADAYNPKTVRGAMGSLFRVKISRVSNLISTVEEIKKSGRRVFAAELSDEAISLTEAGLCGTDIVMIGNEGHGIPSEISAVCTNSVYIPISSKTESLNASVAAAVFMWEQSKGN
jgi:TrmH family RNA methyltransferase